MAYAGHVSGGGGSGRFGGADRGEFMGYGAHVPGGGGRGFSLPPGGPNFLGGRRSQPSSSAGPAVDIDDEDEEEIAPGGKKTFDKANWTEANTLTLCEIAVEEMRDGNCPNGVWTTRGAFRRHSTKQIKNRFDTLKKWYCAWVWLGFQTGYGRGPNNEIVASAGWWAKRIKDNKHAKKFQFGNPEYLDLLIEMYQGVAVDGSTAYFPGDEGEEVGDDDFDNSPMSTSSRKRGSSSCDNATATSPGKKSKSPVVKFMRGLLTSFSIDINKRGKSREKSQNIFVEELTRCQRLAIECGAPEKSVEYFCATQLFAEAHNRVMFMIMKTKEARLMWLKRWCQ
ncbi:hypothetical protein PVAP13_2KG328000 [Panicum virgatum]|uniref:Myb/SANT-like domain-containing protein n=1 Tax=Panicum virgatum TaxID=38727 RepID=A0A8T0W181_PANVG|nr:hypothetical protein PVAP13_2KG328000 [Panicum virgatum]